VGRDNIHSLPSYEFAEPLGGSGVEVLSKLNVQDWSAFFRLGIREVFHHNDIILKEGKVGDAIYFISDGEVRIERSDGDERIELARLSSGSIFGEMSFLDGAGVSADVIAEGHVEVFRVDNMGLRETLKFQPEFGQRLYHSLAVTLSRRLRATNRIAGKSTH